MSTNTRVQRSRMDGIKQEGKKVAHQATTSPIMEALMRLGYVVRGLICGVIGVLAFQVAVGGGGTLSDPQGAIVEMGKTTVGAIVLYAILAGLIGYGFWVVIRHLLPPLP